MTHASPAIANEFVELNGGAMAQMRMHKLAYIAHGWNLAINREPLIGEAPEAWDNGPVFRTIWNLIRDFGTDGRGRILRTNGRPFVAALRENERDILEHVWGRYKKYDADTLSKMTHEPGTPWTRVYFSRGRNSPIPNDMIESHYRDLAIAGRRSS